MLTIARSIIAPSCSHFKMHDPCTRVFYGRENEKLAGLKTKKWLKREFTMHDGDGDDDGVG